MDATAKAYVISRQGNRNLVLDSKDLEFFGDFSIADSTAHEKARLTGRAYYVHELTVKAVRRHRPSTQVKSEDL